MPLAELRVSQQHRMLARSAVIERITGNDEALVPAKFLLPLPGFELQADVRLISYLHLLFDRHEIVYAEGAPSESLFPGPQAFEMLSPKCRDEIDSLLPKMEGWRDGGSPARPFLKGQKLRQAVKRHLKNAKPILSPETKRSKETVKARRAVAAKHILDNERNY